MKNNIIISILLSTVCLTSCQQDIQETGNYIGKHISVSAQAGEDTSTRTTLNGFQTQWVAGDQIGVFSPQSDDSNHPHTATTDAVVSPFNGTMVWSKDPHDFYAYYPYVDGAFTYTAVPVSLPAVQTQTAANSSEHIAALDFMVASPLTGIEVGGEVSFQFSHLFTLLEFRVVGSGEISMIEFATDASANLAFSGGTIDISQMKPTDDAPFVITYPPTTDSSVSLTLANPATLTDDSETTPALYMMINPIDLASQQLTVTATINGTPKTITANGFRFERGRKYVLVAVPEEDLLIIAKTEYEFEKEGGTLTFDVEHNVDFDIMIDESAQSWIKPIETRALETTTLSFSISAYEEEGERMGTIMLSKGNVKQTITVKQKGVDLIALQRAALIAIYNATGGDNWTNNTNWCSDRPVDEWYGVYVNAGKIDGLYLIGNNLIGNIPAEIGDLVNLQNLNLNINKLSGNIPAEIGNLVHLQNLNLGHNNLSGNVPAEIGNLVNLQGLWLTNYGLTTPLPKEIFNLKELKYLHTSQMTLPAEISNCSNLIEISMSDCQLFKEICNLPNLERLYATGLSGELPTNLGNLNKLKHLSIDGSNGLTGSIPSSIGGLTEIESLEFNYCLFNGSIPSEIGQLGKLKSLTIINCGITGAIPAEIGNCKQLTYLGLARNNLFGNIPEQVASLPNLEFLLLYENNLSGIIPEALQRNNICWDQCWAYILSENNFEWGNTTINAAKFDVVDLNNNRIIAADEYAKNKYIALFQFSPYFNAFTRIDKLIDIYETYKNRGLDILGYNFVEEGHGSSVGEVRNYVLSHNIPWRIICWDSNNQISDNNLNWPYRIYYPYHSYPFVTLVDSNGKVVFYSDYQDGNFTGLNIFLNDKLGGGNIPTFYTSTDYSADGKVTTLQKATQGNGIDIVLMGDAYSDRLIADGTYEQTMRKAMDFFFTEEPYKSHRDMFNVYAVNVVSKNEVYDAYSMTALNGYFGGGTLVGGSDAKCVEYAQKAITADRLDDALIVVMMNSENYGGTCYMYYPANGDYGRGLSIAYFPIGTNDGDFESLLHHEAGGHGFAKLADEYAYEFMGGIPASEITSTKQMEPYGWWRNVDFTNNPEQVKWAKYLTDNRYAQEGLGIYEGALTYWTGAYRPTDYSIMRYNTGGFNAPSREAIYYRIHKLAYGSGWTYNYEAFVSYDAINRTFAANAARARQAVARTRPFKPQTPPVVIPHSWREAK